MTLAAKQADPLPASRPDSTQVRRATVLRGTVLLTVLAIALGAVALVAAGIGAYHIPRSKSPDRSSAAWASTGVRPPTRSPTRCCGTSASPASSSP